MADIAKVQAKEKLDKALKLINGFFKKEWPKYQAKVEEAQPPLFKQYESLEFRN